MHSHNTAFSLVKAIGIIAIVIGHAAVRTPLCSFVYLFHIAVFFFVAGYFFNDEAPKQIGIRPAAGFLRNKLRRLYLPYVTLGILFVLLHNLFIRLHIIAYNFGAGTPILPYDTPQLAYRLLRVVFFSWHEQPLAPLWFLCGMFTTLVGFFILSWCCHRLAPRHFERLRGAAIALLTLFGLLWLAHPLGFAGEQLLCRCFLLLPLLYLGRLYALFERRIPLHMGFACLCLLGLLIATACGYRINVGALEWGNPLLFAAITCAGCYMVLTFAQALAAHNNRLVRALDYIGRNTMSIMLLHLIAFKLVNLLQIYIYDYPTRYLAYHTVIPLHTWFWWLPYTLVGIVLPLGAAWLWDRFRKARAR